MIKIHIASAAAVFTFALASLGGAVVAIAAPANAETTSSVDGTSMTGTAGPAVTDARTVSDELEDATRGPDVTHVPAPGSAARQEHQPFPHRPHSPHEGQGHKGSNDQPRPHIHVPAPSPVKSGH